MAPPTPATPKPGTRATPPKPRRLLGIWPHPDDEAYLSAGLMGRTTDAGGHVTVLTLTRGTKGTSDPADYDQPQFGARRERELRASLAEVGVHDLRVGDYRDGECDLVPDEVAIELIAATITTVAPDTIVTFGPDGITGHTDHCVVSAWVTEAWRRTPGAELLYATMTDAHIARWAELHERIRLFADRGAAGPAPVPPDQVALTVEMKGAELDRKRRALARHASQTEPLAAFMGEATYRAWLRSEYLRRPTAEEIRSCALTVASHDPRVAT